MTKEWVRKQTKERDKNLTQTKACLYNELSLSDIFDEDIKERLMKLVENEHLYVDKNDFLIYCNSESEEAEELCKKLGILAEEICNLQRYDPTRYIDSEPVFFNGDIIITDPCYVTKDEDWDKYCCGSSFEELGVKCIDRDTIYGDWSCTVYDDKKKVLGNFCADAGMVAVFNLKDALEYNPQFDYHIERPWTTAWIKNFKGTVRFVVKKIRYKYNDEWCTDFEVRVVGEGINSETGEPLNFIGLQTGL